MITDQMVDLGCREAVALAQEALPDNDVPGWEDGPSDERTKMQKIVRRILTAALGDAVVVPREALMWLHGEGPDADGKWFVDLEDEVIRTPRKYTPRYWWRSKFRSMIPNWSAVPRNNLCTPKLTEGHLDDKECGNHSAGSPPR